MNETHEAKILLVDDSVRLRSRLEDFLESHNFGVKCLPDGRDAKDAIAEYRPDLLLLDIMMPGRDGFEVLRSVRESFSVPVIMLTACNNKTDRVRGLDHGADDFLGKPFHLGELLARIRAVLRRSKAAPAGPAEAGEGGGGEIVRGPLRLNVGRQRLSAEQKNRSLKKNLTNLEFRLFYLFMSRADEILSRDEILEYLFENRESVEGQSLRVYINRVRKILSELELDPGSVVTVWGSGYLFRIIS
ncbi:MAG: response regulator transcription factor [Deltaproteobacteria bacterium]|jgi:DNA-binding response OmpR family regulator|nr:response regulator transcription factor [Deltaproteobacteria bacterium]